MGLKCQLIINMDTQEFFTFTVGDGYSTNINLRKNWNKSHGNLINSNGPTMEPCGTPKIISDHELYVPFSFTLCFHLVKYENNSFKEGISTP